MNLPTFRQILGAFRLVRRRAVEVERPGLAIWAEAGERAAEGIGAQVRDTAHRAEVEADEVEQTLKEILADGKVTPADLQKLKRLPGRVHRVAEECHDVGEAVQS